MAGPGPDSGTVTKLLLGHLPTSLEDTGEGLGRMSRLALSSCSHRDASSDRLTDHRILADRLAGSKGLIQRVFD